MALILALLMLILCFCSTASAQVPVQLAPWPKMQFFDQNGVVLSGGIVCTYQAGTNTPQATYTDSTGRFQNPNPIVLDSAGRAAIWLTSAAYKVVVAAGGTCSSPSNLQWTVDNVIVPPFANGNNSWTGNETHSGTETFNGPLVTTGGGTLGGSFGGNPNFTGNPSFSGSPTFPGGLTLSQVTSANSNPATTGLVRASSGDQICWRNTANTADICISKSAADTPYWGTVPFALIEPPVTLGFSATPVFDASAGTVFDLTLTGNVTSSTFNNSVLGQTYIFIIHQDATGGRTFVWPSNVPGTAINASASSTSVQVFVVDAAGNIQPYVTLPTPHAVNSTSETPLAGDIVLTNNTPTTIITKTVTMPATGGPWRVLTSYGIYILMANFSDNEVSITSWVSDGTATMATSQNVNGSLSIAGGISGGQISPSYANGAVVTFTLQLVEQSARQATAKVSPAAGSSQSSYLSLTVLSSN